MEVSESPRRTFSLDGWPSPVAESQGGGPGTAPLETAPQGLEAAFLDGVTTTRPTWNLNNASAWRDGIFAVNGMETEMQYGGADRASRSRLENLGLRGKRARFRAVLLHLDHDRPYKTKESDPEKQRHRRRIVQPGRNQGERWPGGGRSGPEWTGPGISGVRTRRKEEPPLWGAVRVVRKRCGLER